MGLRCRQSPERKLKLSAASCGESSILKKNKTFRLRLAGGFTQEGGGRTVAATLMIS
jgi:hypothetical protein